MTIQVSLQKLKTFFRSFNYKGIRNNIEKCLCLLVCLFSFCSWSAIATQKAITIKVGLAPPYVTEKPEIDSSANIGGVATNIVREAYNEVDVETEFKIGDWHTTKLAIDSEKVLSFWWQINRQREKSWLFSQPLYEAQYVFLARKEVRFYWTRFDQLRPYKIGISHIQSYGTLFDSYIQYLNTDKTLSDYSAIKKLISKDLDAILIERSMAKYLLTFLSPTERDSLELLENQVIHKEPYYLVCGKFFNNCSYYINKFNEGLKSLKTSDRYDALLEQR